MTNPHGTPGDDPDWSLSPTSRKPVPDLVGDRVLELVRGGELTPGDRLPTEPDLARQMGVARSSVRTGLQRLEARGVVQVERGRGWFVAPEPDRSAADLMLDRLAGREFDPVEVMEVRIALESTAAALAAARATPGQLDEIMKLARSHEAADPEDSAAILQSDEDFHAAIVDSTGSDFLRTVYAMITPPLATARERSLAIPHLHMRSATEHNQIAAWLRRRDETGARFAMTSHLLGLYQDLVRERADSSRDPVPAAASMSTFVDIDTEVPTLHPGDESR